MAKAWVSRFAFQDVAPPLGQQFGIDVIFTVPEGDLNHLVEVSVLLQTDDSLSIEAVKERAVAKAREVLQRALAG
jgi:hypothetical protein